MNGSSLPEKFKAAWRFLTSDVWDIEPSSLTAMRGFLVKSVRVVHLVFKGFQEDECPLHASALTFNTLMALVPVLAISLALARGLGDAETVKVKIRAGVREWTSTFQQQAAARHETNTLAVTGSVPTGSTAGVPSTDAFDDTRLGEEIDAMVGEVLEKVENISFAALGGVGLVLLIWMVIGVLGKVEASFNRVWGVTVGRSAWRCFTDYLSVLLVVPILIVAASSLPLADFATRFLPGEQAQMVRSVLGSGWLKHLTVGVMSVLTFSFVLMFMPNTRVKVGPGVAGGAVSAALFLGWLWICASFQVWVANYGRIYGSFATVPILLAWIYVSWEIVLFGAEVAFALQNCTTYRMEQGARKASMESRVTLALALAAQVARGMLQKERMPFSAAVFAAQKRVPVRFLKDVIADLCHAGILGQLSDEPDHYVLLRAPESLRVKEVMDTMIRSGMAPESLGLGRIDAQVAAVTERIDRGAEQTLSRMTVRDLVEERSSR